MSNSKKKEYVDPDFGIRLKQAFNGIPNLEISKLLTVSKSTVTEYVQGRVPPADKLIEIEKLTACDLNWLLTGRYSNQRRVHRSIPQGIIFQGSKGGIGVTVSALMIASALAHKGYRVLLADNESGSGAARAFYEPNKEKINWKEERPPTVENSYSPTKNNNLDIFAPAGWRVRKYKNRDFLSFDETMVKNYDFILFDSQCNSNPFRYPYHTTKSFPLDVVLKNSQVLALHDVVDSFGSATQDYLLYVAQQRLTYPNADFLGLVLIDHLGQHNLNQSEYDSRILKLRNQFGENLLQTNIHWDPAIGREQTSFGKFIYTKRTKAHKNYADVVDEMLEKLK